MKKSLTIFMLAVLCSISSYAQRTITGSITDAAGEPLISASVYIKSNPSLGTVTELDGTYSLIVPDDAEILVFRYTGYMTREIAIGTSTTIDVTMEEDTGLLEEVVVIGYGSTSKRNLTDNIAKLSSDDIKNVPVSNFQSALSGKAAGVRVNQINGKVDAGIVMRIRGAASISAGTDPLYVLDGVPLINQNESSNGAPTNPLLSLSASEIESIDILKDASSAAIYGARAANGVVLITTKRGKAGKATVSVNMSHGVSEPTHLVEWLNTSEYVELFTEAAKNSTDLVGWPGEGYVEARFDRYSNGTDWRNGEINTDWNDVAFRQGSQSNIDLSVSGGDQKTVFYFGGTYTDNQGIIIGNALDRITARANVKHNFNDKLTAGLNLGYSKTNIDRVANDNAFTTPLQAIAQAPLSPARLADGTPFANTVYANFLLENDYADYLTKLNRINGKAYLQYNILENLKFNSDLGYDQSLQTEDQFRASNTPFQSTNGSSFSSNVNAESYIFSNYLTYAKLLGDRHDLNFVVGTEYNKADRRFVSVTGNEFPSDDLTTVNSAAEITAGSGSLTAYNFLSYFARATYILDDKYFLKGSIRRDGSSRFGKNRRFGTFPAVSAGWIVSNEDFLRENPTLSFLKLRASYGELGNAEIGNFPSQYLIQGVSYNQRPGLAPTQPGNADLTWETSRQFDLGLEFGLFNNKVSGEIDYYTKNTEGLLFSVPLPGSSGAGSINRNIGELAIKGIEFVLNTENFKSGDFSWNTSFNVGTNINEIVSLPNNDSDIVSGRNVNRVGEPVSAFYMPEYAGVDPENGDALYYINGEDSGRETTNNYNEANRIVAGNPFPELTAGLTNTLNYGNLSLGFTFMGEWGASIYNGGGRFQSANADWFDNQTKDQLNRWQKPGDVTDIPQARLGLGNGTGHSTRWLEKADFIRLRNVSLSYNLPKSVLDATGFTNASVYVNGVNLLTFTDYPGYDPESRGDSGSYLSGEAFYSAPSARTVSFGINLNF